MFARPLVHSVALSVTLGTLVACSSGNHTVSPSVSSPSESKQAASRIFVETSETRYANSNPNPIYSSAVLQFPAGSSGAATPTFNMPVTTAQVEGLALDPAGNLYVGKVTYNDTNAVASTFIDVYGPNVSASSTPIRTLTLPVAAFPASLFIDSSGQLYALVLTANTSTIYVFPNGASGPATPSRVITGNQTQLTANQTFGLSVDTIGNIFVGCYQPSEILVFSPSANGNTAPARSITFSAGNVYGVANDGQGNIYAALDSEVFLSDQTTSSTANIQVLAPDASGPAAPMRTIAGAATTFSFVGGMRIDAADNLWALNLTGSGPGPNPSPTDQPYTNHIVEFAPDANGNVTPLVNFQSSQWGSGGSEIAVE